MTVQHLKITQAGAVAALTFIVGQLVAFVPSMGPDKQNLIAAGSAVIAAAFLVANSVHALASSKQPDLLLTPGTPADRIVAAGAPDPVAPVAPPAS